MYVLQAFDPSVSCGGELATKVSVQVKPVDTTVEAGAQVQQMINIECIEDFRGISKHDLSRKVYRRCL